MIAHGQRPRAEGGADVMEVECLIILIFECYAGGPY